MRLNPQKFSACVAKISQKAAIGDQEALDILETVADEAEKLRQQGVSDPFNKAARTLFSQMAANARQQSLIAMRNLQIVHQQYKYIDDPNLVGAERGRKAAERLRSLFIWQPGGDLSRQMSAKRWEVINLLTDPMNAQLRKLGLSRYAKSKKSTLDIVRALWDLSNGGSPKGPAGQVARLLLGPLEELKVRLNAAGAKIDNSLNYFLNADHDRVLMLYGGNKQGRAGSVDEAFKRWYTLLQRVADQRTWAPAKPRGNETVAQARERYARQLFDVRTSGANRVAGARQSSTMTGAAKLAKAFDEGRAIYFKDADAWAAYQQVYGSHQDMWRASTTAIMLGARDLALFQTFGTRYASGMDKVIKMFDDSVREIDSDALVEFKKQLNGGFTGRKGGIWQPNIYDLMAEMDGSAHLPQFGLIFNIERTIIPWYTAVKLGNVFNDLGSMVSTFPRTAANNFGGKTFESIGQAMKALIPYKFRSPEYLEVASEFLAFSEGIARQTYDDFLYGLGPVGIASNAARTVMQISGINFISDRVRTGIRHMFAEKLGRWRGLAFDKLNPQLQAMFKAYDISPAEWDALRRQKTSRIGSNHYLTPTHIVRMSDVDIQALIAARGSKLDVATFRQQFAQRLGMFFHDIALQSNVTPGIRERAIMRAGTRPGTLGSLMATSMLMFKSWPLAALYQNLGREIYQNTGNRFRGIATMMALSAIGGYLSLAAKGFMTGAGVPEAKDGRTALNIALKSLALGGGLGLLGDFTIAEAGRMTASDTFGPLAVGPFLQDLGKLGAISANLVSSIGSDKPYKEFWPDLLRLVRSSGFPGANIIWFRGTIDYLFWYQLYEAASPGWWERSNRALEQTQGRPRMGYAPGRGIPVSPLLGGL